MARYDLWFPTIKVEEGSIMTKDPSDSGGRTVYGISEVKHPGNPIWAKIDAAGLQPGDDCSAFVKDFYNFYYIEFWVPCGGNLLTDQATAQKIADSAVNGGIPEAIKEMQAVVNVPLTGVMDITTIQALNN